MKLLLNNKEIAYFLLSLIDHYNPSLSIALEEDELNDVKEYIV